MRKFLFNIAFSHMEIKVRHRKGEYGYNFTPNWVIILELFPHELEDEELIKRKLIERLALISRIYKEVEIVYYAFQSMN